MEHNFIQIHLKLYYIISKGTVSNDFKQLLIDIGGCRLKAKAMALALFSEDEEIFGHVPWRVRYDVYLL